MLNEADPPQPEDAETPFEAHDLFAVPIWSTVLPSLAASVPSMTTDIQALLATDMVVGAPGRQTDVVLQQLPGSHWERFFRVLLAFTDHIAADFRPTWRSRRHFSWGLEYRRLSDYSETDDYHTHIAASISTVFYLNVPREYDAVGGVGTVLRNPLKSVQHRYGAPDTATFVAETHRLLAFPSYLEHTSERPPLPADFSSSRLCVVTDVCYY